MDLRVSRYETVEDAYHGLSKRLVNDPTWPDGYRGTYNLRLFSHDHIVIVNKPRSTLNIAQVDFKANRWYQKWLSEYLERDDWIRFLELLEKRKSREAQEYGYICPTKARHSLGNCLFGVSVRTGKKCRVNVFSRSVYLQPVGILDLSFGALLCEYVARITKQEYCELVWHVGQFQTNSWKILPYILNNGLDVNTYVEEVWNKIPGMEPIIPNEWQRMWATKLIRAEKYCREKMDPNPRYMFYARMMKKYDQITARIDSGQDLPLIVPHFPDHYLPENHRTGFVGPLVDDDEIGGDDDDD